MLNFYRIKYDYLKFEGNERLDLVNRLSTNEVNSLDRLKGKKTILTTDKGRFVDILSLYNFGEFVFASCSFNNAEKVIAHLDKYTIMDDFGVTGMAGTHEAVLFFGTGNNSFALDALNVDTTVFSDNDFSFNNEGERHTIIAANDDPIGGFIFIYSINDKKYWNEKIFSLENIDKYSLNEITDDEYDVMRIEYGIPVYGKEMSELTNPLECGLNKYVSFTKGCYIGQEVIARLDAYDKINKHMVGFKSAEPVGITGQNGEIKISTDNKECGFVTSSATSQNFGNIGLGFVKTLFLDYEKDYVIKDKGKTINCKIVKLPFLNG